MLTVARAQSLPIKAAAPEFIETGVPPFVVLGPEALGLSTAPVDLHQLPDGRLLAMGHNELALGDGVRWQVFRQAEDDQKVDTASVAVDESGQIYAGISGGFARIDFGVDGRWRFKLVSQLPAEAAGQGIPALTNTAAVGNEWFWWWGSGPIISWRPGTTARLVGRANAPERVFLLDGKIHLSDGSDGNLFRMEAGSFISITTPNVIRIEQSITSVVPLKGNRALVGTIASGVHIADGTSLQPLATHGLLASGRRINDLCRTDSDCFAAAIDNVGIVFFDRTGRILQVLDRAIDHRLARATRLLPTPGGVVWALLNEGLARVGFPARVSQIEPLVPTSLAFAQPYRYNDQLWLLSDGRTQRGIYDESNRLVRFEIDTVPGYVCSMADLNGALLACSSMGIFLREGQKWTLVAAGPASPYINTVAVAPDRWLYAAENEVGWLRRLHGQFQLERFPVPELGHVYGGLDDAQGRFWVELGTGKAALIDPRPSRPAVAIFGPPEGVPDDWVQLFNIDGVVRINAAGQILRLDETLHRFVPDSQLLQRMPELAGANGRPIRDARGRIWVTSRGRVHIYDPAVPHAIESAEAIPEGLLTLHFTPQTDGVVWLHQRQRLARYDPSMPAGQPAPLRALLTSIQFPNTNREIFPAGSALSPLAASDNAFVVHFLAPNNSLGQSVTFEVKLEGAPGDWVSTGATGSAAFNHLDQGEYKLRVRPRHGDSTGTEATLAFTILAPWYRTPYAYLAFVLSALGLVLFAIRVSTFFERRENLRLERLVTQRTVQLHESNLRLASQVEEIQMLSQAISQSPVNVLITRPDGAIVFANPRVCDLTGYTLTELIGQNVARLRGVEVTPGLLAEMATTIQRGDSWHGQLTELRKDGRTLQVRTTVSPIRGPDGQIRLHLILEEDITDWLADQERHRRLEAQLTQSQKLESIGTLAGGIAHDFNNILTGILGYSELARLTAPPDPELQEQLEQIRTAGLRAKDLISQILTFSRRSITRQTPLDLAKSVTEAVKLIRASTPATIEITSTLESGLINADPTQIQQVVLNLCANAVHAMRDRPGRLDLTVQNLEVDATLAAEVPHLPEGPAMRLTVADNGHGMDPATLERMFDPYFTTKGPGEGTGLGLAIVRGVIASHRGTLRVQSTPDIGSTFELYFPRITGTIPTQAPQEPTPRGDRQEILVVDDEPSVGQYVAKRLRRLGYQVMLHRDPREALAALQEAPTRFHALVTDLTMPHLTGIQLMQAARVASPGLATVLITGYGLTAEGNHFELLPRSRMLQKPFSGEDLARALHQVIHEPAA